jgi:uncharacterized repeat protein (TIGR01451 family)
VSTTVDRETDRPAEDAASDDPAERPPERSSVDPDDGSTADEGDGEAVAGEVGVETRSSDRWSAGFVLALFAGAAGGVLGNPVLFLGAVVGLAYAAYGSLTRAPPLAVDVERTVSASAPLPGDVVGVTLTVTNASERPVADLRIVDGVPVGLSCVEGEARACVSLRPGETTVLRYDLLATRGDHEFSGPRLLARNASATVRRSATADVTSTLHVDTSLDAPPLHGRTLPYPGETATDDGGEGVEFYSVRQYVRGDPMSRIDWKRYARTTELSTVSFREEEAASVVVLVDDRQAARVARDGGETGAGLAAHAARRLADALLEENDRVGVASLDAGSYVRSATGRDQRARIARFLDDPASVEGRPGVLADVCRYGVTRLCRHLDRRARVVFCSPLADDEAVETAETLLARGHAVTVVAPDVTPDTAGGTVASIERSKRVDDLRSAGVRVVEWSPDDALALAFARARRRWSA